MTEPTEEEVEVKVEKRQGLFSSPGNMITRDDALQFMSEVETNFGSLPDVLKNNNLKADHLLFKEAQQAYSKRKQELEKQIVIDNVHFAT